jgi:UDP-2,4-diacetamido-2,4,6-trideoxy-beta-L-altropyranose hydrolase
LKLEKNFFFRTDASNDIGFGHVIRCLTLAKGLIQAGAQVEFITRSHVGNLIKYIERKGFKVHTLHNAKTLTSKKNEDEYASWLQVSQEKDAKDTIEILKNYQADWIIVDHYSIDEVWEKRIQPYARKIMIIDDLANRKHYCNLLLDMTVNRKESDYLLKTTEDCKILVGAKYILMRDQFKANKPIALMRRKNMSDVKRILISLGGTDPLNITSWVLNEIETANIRSDIEIDVIINSDKGQSNIIRKQIEFSSNKILIHHNVENMSDFMTNADLGIGACGISAWERCCLGLPTIVVVTEENQKTNARNLQNLGAIINLGWYKNIDEYEFRKVLQKIIQSKEKRFLLSKKSSEVCDGEGVSRVIKSMIYAD